MPDYDRAVQEAKNLIQKYGIEYPLVDVFAIAKGEDLKLMQYDPNSEEVLKNASGFFDPATKTIYVNKLDPPTRQTFTVAHELGHYILKHRPEAYDVLPRWQEPGKEKNPIEKEADVFAANLLVPEDMLKKVMNETKLQPNDAALLAKLFGVSEQVMSFRIKRVFS